MAGNFCPCAIHLAETAPKLCTDAHVVQNSQPAALLKALILEFQQDALSQTLFAPKPSPDSDKDLEDIFRAHPLRE